MIGVGALSLEEAWEAVHVPTLILLFAFMVVSAQLRMGGFYTWVTHKTGHLPLSPPKLLAALIAWRNRGAWELTFEEAATAAVPPHGEPPPRVDRWQTAKGLAVAAIVFILFLAAPMPREVVALTAAGVLMMSRRLHSRKMLALASTLAGNLLIVGRFANIIVVDAAGRRGVHIDWKRHARTGIPVTLATMAISWAYLWFRVLH